MQDTAVFFLTHQWSESIAFRFMRLRRELSSRADCFVLLHDDGGPLVRGWQKFLESMDAGSALLPFTPEAVANELGIPLFGEKGVLGNTHLPMIAAAQRGAWRHCWQIESDVEYRGAWSDFFALFDASEADLLASHIHRHEDWPTWKWWMSLRAPDAAPILKADILKAFFPVFRISRAGIEAVLQAQRDGWSGHFEALVPTVLAMRGMKVEDLRASTPCYIGDSQNPNAIVPVQSTMRWRPEITMREFAGRANGPLLFHPVKQNWAYEPGGVRSWPEQLQA